MPELSDEYTDHLVQQIAKDLLKVEIHPTDISIGHRLPAKRGQVRPIIAKFTRRNIRDKIYGPKRKLTRVNSTHLGFTRTSITSYI